MNKRGRDPKYCQTCNPRALRLWAKFKIRLEEWNKLLEVQGGGCAICGTEANLGGLRNLAVDHCHETGAIRGLLCLRCNMGIGYLGDDIARIRRAADYLEHPVVEAAGDAPDKSESPAYS